MSTKLYMARILSPQFMRFENSVTWNIFPLLTTSWSWDKHVSTAKSQACLKYLCIIINDQTKTSFLMVRLALTFGVKIWLFQSKLLSIQIRFLKKHSQIYKQLARKFALNFSLFRLNVINFEQLAPGAGCTKAG